MGQLVELARQRLTRWMDANQKITQRLVGEAVRHEQSWVSNFRSGAQQADVDELDAMARVFGNTLTELLDLRGNPKERDLLDAFYALPPEKRDFAIEMLRQIAPPKKRGRSRKQNDER